MTNTFNELSAMHATVAAVVESLDLGIDLRMFGEGTTMPSDGIYGELWLIGGYGFVVDEKAREPIVRRVGLVQLTVWKPLRLKSGSNKRILSKFNRGFVGLMFCDLHRRSYTKLR